MSDVTRNVGSSGPYSSLVGELIDAALRGADEKMGRDPVVLDLRTLIDSFDAMVIVHGASDRQVRAIAEEIEERVDHAVGLKPLRVEGWASGEWIAMDYGDVMIHVFDEPTRDYYDLEHLWSAAPTQRNAGPLYDAAGER